MAYSVKEIYYTLQGEGAQSGRPSVFCRFAGCNLWSGREEDRESAVCRFCDTDFLGTDGILGGRYGSAAELAEAVAELWPGARSNGVPYVVFTGGEPLLQLDRELIAAVHREGFEVGVETNGTVAAPSGIDWLCVSPKAGTELVLREGNEIKLVFPQPGAEPASFEGLQFDHYFLQPMDGAEGEVNREKTVRFCLENPRWRLSLQTHKVLGLD